MAADDFLNNPDQGAAPDLASSPYSGNRPASGARRATPGEVLSQGFQGAQNAGDFLGLDVEFTASQDPNQAYGAGSLDLVSPPSTHDPAADTGLDSVVEPAPQPEGDPVQEFAEAPSAFEFGEDLGSEEGDLADLTMPTSSKKPLLVGGLVLGLLGGAGAYFWPTLSAQFFGTPTEVAHVDPTPSPVSPKSHTPAKTPDVATKNPSTEPTASTETPETLPNASSTPASVVEQAPDVRPTAQVESGSGVTPAPQASSGSDVLETLAANPSGPVSAQTAPSTFPNLSGSEYSWNSEDQLEMIWRGTEVPLEAVDAPAKTLMPHVGAVRVFMDTGDVFEGRLYAVGQGHVWIDAAPGRVGLDGKRVERIEGLPPAPAGVKASLADADLSGGKRVRVRVPGGMLYGHVLKADGDEVILAREGGGRVRVKASDVEDLGSGRTIVVGR